MINFNPKDRYGFADLVEIMALLRSPEGCPWDRAQDHASIRRNFIEEVYETVDAIDQQDDAGLREELGDVMMQVVFHAQIARENGRFTIDDVTDEVCKKLIHRHPHIFAGVSAHTSEEVIRNWDAIKRQEKGQKNTAQTMEQIPHSLPALMYAEKMQSRAQKGGFQWPALPQALEALQQLAAGLGPAVEQGCGQQALGDVLFAAVAAARLCQADPEECLYRASQRFLTQFGQMEEAAPAPLQEMTEAQQQALWEQVKNRQ